MEHGSDINTNYYRCYWYSDQRINKRTIGLGKKKD